MRLRLAMILMLLPALAACNLATRLEPTPEPTSAAPVYTPGPVSTVEVAPTGPPASQGQVGVEAITIREPGPGSRLVNAILLRGMVTIPVFENTLTARVVWDDGTEALPPTPIPVTGQADQTGTFDVTLPFTVSGERNAFILVYAVSPRDGGVTHLTSSSVRLAEHGTNEVVITQDQPERLSIRSPATGGTISGGVAHVEGFGLAAFEQTLTVEVLDASGASLGKQPVIVQAPDLGMPGPFQVDVPYSAAAPGAGRIVVHDVSPAFGGDSHLASVEIQISP